MNVISGKEIAFIGKIAAGVTHEINNALASIKEISGLLEDLLTVSSTDSFPHHEKFLNAVPRIKQQVERCVKLTNQLNKFSHLADEHTATVEINDIIDHLVFLTQRFARNKNVELLSIPEGKTLNITTCPLQLQMAIFYTITYFLNISSEGGKLTVQTLTDERNYSFIITFDGKFIDQEKLFSDESSNNELVSLYEAMSSLNGTVEFNKLEKSITLTFTNEQL